MNGFTTTRNTADQRMGLEMRWYAVALVTAAIAISDIRLPQPLTIPQRGSSPQSATKQRP